MNIFVEGTPVFRNKNIPKAGIGYYTENIFKALQKLDHSNRYTLFGLYFFGKSTEFKSDFDNKTNYKLIRYVPGKIWNIANRKGLLPPIQILMAANPDLIIYTNFRRYPQLGNAKSFVVVHDIAFARFPDTVNLKNKRYLEKYVPKSIEKADKVLAVSEFTKQEIINYYKVDPKKVIVTHNAVDTNRFKRVANTNAVRSKYKIPGKYILFMGTIEPRKNIERLVKAYSLLPDKIKSEYTLVLAGGKGWLDENIDQAIALVAGGSVLRTGYIDHNDMPALYSGADLFVFPSLYEGFGIPILEAMACDTPVLTGKNSSLPEVGGDAAYYVDENSVESIRNGITKLLQDKKLCDELVQKGRQQIRIFSWEKSAKVIINEIKKN